MDRIVSKVAFYVTARKSSTLLALPSPTFDALLRYLPGRRRVTTFGTWRRSRRRAATPSPRETT
ncbi:MAG TPA: hypothetical protein VEB43_04570 [Anaeromyxobacter sp.]|nr:hypothetical protein [Anaeromyxobacter sp.]